MTTLSATKLVTLAYRSVFTNLMQIVRISLGWLLLYFLLLAVAGIPFGAYSLVVWGILFIVIIVLSFIMPAAMATNWHSFLLEKDDKTRQSSGLINRLFRLGLNSNVYTYLWTVLWLGILAGAPLLLLVVLNDLAFWLEVTGYESMGGSVSASTAYLIFSLLWYVFILARYGLVLPATAVETDEENDMTFSMAAKLSASRRIPLFLALLVSLIPMFALTSTVSPFTIQNMISNSQTNLSLKQVRKIKMVSAKQVPSRVWVIVKLFGMLTVFSYIYLLMTLLPLAVLSHAYRQLYDGANLAVFSE